MKTTVAAVDLGATSGRVIVGVWSAGGLQLTEVHRFPNAVHELAGRSYWDVGGLFTEVRKGLLEARRLFPDLKSCGVDTWGVDHALVDAGGRLVYPVHAYRDERTNPLVEEQKAAGHAEKLYRWGGLPLINYNTALQLAESLRACPTLAEAAARCLLLPDYFNFLLCGVMANEFSIASTGQLVDAASQGLSRETLAHFGIPEKWFEGPATAGRVLGPVRGLKGLEGVQVALVPGHDTSCAFEAIPRQPGDLVLSAGTWLLLGTLAQGPSLGADALEFGLSNERTGAGGYRPNKILLGLWLVEQILPAFAERPKNDAEWNALIDQAENAPACGGLLDTTDPRLFKPADMRAAIDAQLRERGLTPPADLHGYLALIWRSLARRVAVAAGTFGALCGADFRRIVVVGGGSKNRFLCQALADASGLPVVSYALEGTAVGNIGYQLLALGAVRSLEEFHAGILRDLAAKAYAPRAAT